MPAQHDDSCDVAGLVASGQDAGSNSPTRTRTQSESRLAGSGTGDGTRGGTREPRADRRSLKRGRLRDVWVLMHSLRYHRQAVAAVIGDKQSREVSAWAGQILHVLESNSASLDRRLMVVGGKVLLAGVGEEPGT
jgi:hypothetical protein